jgi:FMN reductase (NADPH)
MFEIGMEGGMRMNEVIQLLQSHRSIRKFKSIPISPNQIDHIIDSAQKASTSSNVQAYSIIGVSDSDKKQKLAELAGNQQYIEKCPLFLVWCADLYRIDQACRKNQVEMVSGTTENFIVATVDAAIAAQNAAIAAESMGLGIVYIGGIRNQSYEVTKLLNLPSLVYPIFGMCVGFPDHEPSSRPRLARDAVYHQDAYSTEHVLEEIEDYDQMLQAYYIERTGGKRDTTWSKEMSQKFEHAARTHMRSFLEEQGYRFK